MTCQSKGCRCSETKLISITPKEIQERKTELLFQYLRDVLELNRQLKMLEISEHLAQLQKEHDKKMSDLLLQYGK